MVVNIFIAASTLAILVGCQPDILTQAEEMMESYEFKTVIELLDSLNVAPGDGTRLRLLRAKAHFVSGDRDFAFIQLQNLEGSRSKSDYLSAKLLLESANIISREKDRSLEVVDLLDSVLTRDVALKDNVLSLSWARGIEYIDLVGDAGLRYLAFSIRHEPKVLGRLKGFNSQFAKRYDELLKVDQLVQDLALELKSFTRKFGFQPSDISELTSRNNLNSNRFTRMGWDITIDTQNDVVRIVARANSKCPHDIPFSSRLYSH